MQLLDSLKTAATNDTVHQLAGGTVVASSSLISSTDLNAVKAVVISTVLSGLAQIVISLFKKLATKLNGNNQITIKENFNQKSE